MKIPFLFAQVCIDFTAKSTSLFSLWEISSLIIICSFQMEDDWSALLARGVTDEHMPMLVLLFCQRVSTNARPPLVREKTGIFFSSETQCPSIFHYDDPTKILL